MKNPYFLLSLIFNSYCNTLISSCILFSPCFLHRSRIFSDSICIFCKNKNFCCSLPCNGIIFLSALYTNQLKISFLIQTMEKFSKKGICVRTILVNLSSGMTAHQSADLNCQLLPLCIQSCHRNMADSGKSACTTDPETSFCFRIQIDKSSSF